jgi:hypothetical protein
MTAPQTRVDPAWETDFVVELRLLDVDGRRIGDALEQVRAHCAESGESAPEAFGEPAAYARSLELPAVPVRLAGVVGRSLVGLAGMFLTLAALRAWQTAQPFTLTVGLLVEAGVVALAVGLAARYLRAVIDRPVRAIVVAAVLLAAGVTAVELLTAPVAQLPAPPVVAVGAALLLGTAVAEHRAALGETDPVVSPVDPAASARARRAARRTGVIGAWVLPAGTAALAAVGWLFL